MGASPSRLALVSFFLAISICCAALAQDYPVRPIRVITGGGTDVIGRVVGQELSEMWRQQVVNEDRPGAGGSIAAEFVAKSPADGYTLLLAAPTFSINAAWGIAAYDHARDFSPVVQIVTLTPYIVVVHPTLPVRSMQNLIALARARPGELNYATAQAGGSTHLAAELFKLMAKVNIVHVPYKGATNAVVSVMAGETQMMFAVSATALPHVAGGKLRALAVTTPKRTRVVPDLPTIAESGVPGYEVTGWSGLIAPARTPNHIVAKINADVLRALKVPHVLKALENAGYQTVNGSTPQEFTLVISNEIKKWANVIKISGAKIQ